MREPTKYVTDKEKLDYLNKCYLDLVSERSLLKYQLADTILQRDANQKAYLYVKECYEILEKESASLKSQLEHKEQLLKDSIHSWAESDTAIRELAKKHLTEFEINGDSYGVPVMEDIVEKLVAQLEQAQKMVELYEKAIAEAEAIFGGEYADHYGPMFELALKAREARASLERRK